MESSTRAQSTGRLAWPLASVRPAESLWSLMHRFLWLNAPTWGDLERSFGGPALQPFSLLDGSPLLAANVHHGPGFEQANVRSVLGVPLRQKPAGTVAWLRGTAMDDVIPDLRFCPECLAAAYHTVVFQMACVATCPIHDRTLVHGCPECGHPISAQLDRAAVAKPWACQHCGHRLAPAVSLVDPPRVDGRRVIALVDWYRYLGSFAIVAPQPISDWSRLPAFAPAWRHACLEALCGRAAPVALGILRDEVRAGRAVSARCGLRLTRRERWSAAHQDEVRRQSLMYKAYRRHVQKALPPGSRRIMAAYIDGSQGLWRPATSVETQDRRAAAYALLLFRSRMENWPDLFEYGNAALCRRHRQEQVFSSQAMCSASFSARDCQPRSPEGRWLRDHVYLEEVRAVFQESVHRARRMVTLGRYWQSQDLPWGRRLPYSVGVGSPGGLEFRSWGVGDEAE